jgi:hypothetical protein
MGAKETALNKPERRWIILGGDGRHVTIGRHTDPSDEEIARGTAALQSIGSGGWLAIMEGIYYGRGAVSLMMVKELASPCGGWDDAVAAFQQLRTRATSAPSL